MDAKVGNHEKLITLASITINDIDELYRVVDLLNRTVKDRGILFGLAKNRSGQMTFTIYQT